MSAGLSVSPRHSRAFDRHSRESGNPEVRGRRGDARRAAADCRPSFPRFCPSFPRKRESTNQQRHPRESGDKPAARNQARIAANGSLLPLWEKARMRVRRAQARLCGRQESPAPVIPAKAGIQRVAAKPAARNQARIADNGSLLHLWACRGRFQFSSFQRMLESMGRGGR